MTMPFPNSTNIFIPADRDFATSFTNMNRCYNNKNDVYMKTSSGMLEFKITFGME